MQRRRIAPGALAELCFLIVEGIIFLIVEVAVVVEDDPPSIRYHYREGSRRRRRSVSDHLVSFLVSFWEMAWRRKEKFVTVRCMLASGVEIVAQATPLRVGLDHRCVFLAHWTADPAHFSLEARRLLRMLGHPCCVAWNQSRSTRIQLDNTHQGVELRCLVNFSNRIQASWLLRVSHDSHSCASHLCGGNCNVGQGANSGMLLENAGMIAKMRVLISRGS